MFGLSLHTVAENASAPQTPDKMFLAKEIMISWWNKSNLKKKKNYCEISLYKEAKEDSSE